MKIALDIGRSRTRVMTAVDKFKIIDSTSKEISPNAPYREDAENHEEDFIIMSSPWLPVNNRRFVKGDSIRFHKGVVKGATNQELKTYQDDTFVNLIYAVATSMLHGKLTNMFDNSIELGLCIPTAEFFGEHAYKIKESLDGEYEVYFPLLRKTVAFKLEASKVKVSPEGVIAITTLITKSHLKHDIFQGNVIIVDIGYGSTDITILKGGKPEGMSSRSFPIGGITLEAIVESELERQRIFPSKETIASAIANGFVANGSTTIAVGELVQNCKKILAQEIVKSMQKVIVYSMMSEAEINFLFPVGRVFLKSESDNNFNNTGDLAEMIVEYWKSEISILQPMDAGISEEDKNKTSKWELANVIGVWNNL